MSGQHLNNLAKVIHILFPKYSPLLDVPISVKLTTIFWSPRVKTPEYHLIPTQIQNPKNSTYIFLCLLVHTFPLPPFYFRLTLSRHWKKSLKLISQLSIVSTLFNPIWCTRVNFLNWNFSQSTLLHKILKILLSLESKCNSLSWHSSPSEYLTSNSLFDLKSQLFFFLH